MVPSLRSARLNAGVGRLKAMTRFLALLLVCLPALAAEPVAPEIDVFVVIGKTKVRLSVDHRFSDVAGALPKAGRMPITDSHELSHDARTYCYTFGDELLTFHDSDFGVHTAEMAVSPSTANMSCTALKVRPEFEVAGKRFSLNAKHLPKLTTFTSKQEQHMVVLERSWTYKIDESNCSSRSVSVKGMRGQGGFSQITVTNWEEPGC